MIVTAHRTHKQTGKHEKLCFTDSADFKWTSYPFAEEAEFSPSFTMDSLLKNISNKEDINTYDYYISREGDELETFFNSEADKLVQELSAFESFEKLIDAINYRPTIHVNESTKHMRLADLYDSFMELCGISKRAYRVY